LLEELNVKKVSIAESAAGIMATKIEPNMKTLGPKMGRQTAAAKGAIEKLDEAEVAEAARKVANREQVLVSIEGTPTPIDPEDLIVSHSFAEGWAGAADGQTVVLLDTTVTEELKNEGIARDIIRNVQSLRKDAGLDIADRIRLSLVTDSDEMRAAIKQCRDHIAGETLAVQVDGDPSSGPAGQIDVSIGGNKVVIAIAKA
jgi:isoleucyl-tRNA synthetase